MSAKTLLPHELNSTEKIISGTYLWQLSSGFLIYTTNENDTCHNVIYECITLKFLYLPELNGKKATTNYN